MPRMSASTPDTESAEGHGSLPVLALLSLIVGVGSGLTGAAFRLALVQADRLRNSLIDRAHGDHLLGLLLVTGAIAAAVALAAWLADRVAPAASGSGIPQVEAVLRGERPQAPYRLIPVKFFGGLLAIGSGLALGREGPTVQMGASIGGFIGQFFRRNWPDCRVLLAAGAGAGLATAFNAPIAGAIFVLEELVGRFEHRIAIAALGASAAAIAVARVLLVDAPDFHVDALAYASGEIRPLYLRTRRPHRARRDPLQPCPAGDDRRGRRPQALASDLARGRDRRGGRPAGLVRPRTGRRR